MCACVRRNRNQHFFGPRKECCLDRWQGVAPPRLASLTGTMKGVAGQKWAPRERCRSDMKGTFLLCYILVQLGDLWPCLPLSSLYYPLYSG